MAQMVQGGNTSPRLPITVFLKLGDRLKKSQFGGSLKPEIERFLTLRVLGPDAFTTGPRGPAYSFWIVDKNLNSQNELQSMKDVVNNCIVEARSNHAHEQEARDTRSSGILSSIQREVIVFCMVGLPACGKTYIARKLETYLNWLGISTKTFDVANYRRLRFGAKPDSEWFDPMNAEAAKARLHMAIAALDDMIEWLHEGGKVGIYDAANLSRSRRQLISTRCHQENVQLVYIESVCMDPAIIEHNILNTISSPDYLSTSSTMKKREDTLAVEQFKAKIKYFATTFEPLEDNDSLKYIRVFDMGRKVEVRNIRAYLPCRVTFFLMNLHTYTRPIWLTRAATAADASEGEVTLSDAGDDYAAALAEWVAERVSDEQPLTVWTSTMKRAIQTAHYVPRSKMKLRQLDEMDMGDLEGMSIEGRRFPEEYRALKSSPLYYRYPRGESYEDLIHRLEPLIFEIERTRQPLLICAHNAVLQCIYAYLMNKAPEDTPFIEIPHHTVIELIPGAAHCAEHRSRLLSRNYTPRGTAQTPPP